MSEEQAFYENFDYPKVKKLTTREILKRRFSQFQQLLFSDTYQTPAKLHKGVEEHYSHRDEVRYYDSYASFGLHENETEAMDLSLSKLPHEMASALVIGCGAGREAFALNTYPQVDSVTGIDISSDMIAAALKLNKDSSIQFYRQNIETLTQSFDLIWVTSILESHIQGHLNRIHFFKEIYRCLNPKGCVVMTPLIRPLHWRSPNYWSSQLLRLRWLGTGAWESGDVLVSNLGAHRLNDKLVFSHFYPTGEAFRQEIKQAGFSSAEELPQDSWVIQK